MFFDEIGEYPKEIYNNNISMATDYSDVYFYTTDEKEKGSIDVFNLKTKEWKKNLFKGVPYIENPYLLIKYNNLYLFDLRSGNLYCCNNYQNFEKNLTFITKYSVSMRNPVEIKGVLYDIIKGNAITFNLNPKKNEKIKIVVPQLGN
jgi:hypothetical protein